MEGEQELGRRFHNIKLYIKNDCVPLNEIERDTKRLICSLEACQFELLKSAGSSGLTPIDDILTDLQKWQIGYQMVVKELECIIYQDVMPWPSKSAEFVEFLEKVRLVPKDNAEYNAEDTPKRFWWMHAAYRILKNELDNMYWQAVAKRKDLGPTVEKDLKRLEERLDSWYKPIIKMIHGGKPPSAIAD
ncbi:hypothetical protein SLS54_009569 [Diplodia seriata]